MAELIAKWLTIAIALTVLGALAYWFRHDHSALWGFAAATAVFQLGYYQKYREWFY